jgi:hypothetical protein
MKFTGKRLESCLACGGKLPEGSRIDRKYCRAACIERAYYLQHPDRKRAVGSGRRKMVDVAAHSNLPRDPALRLGQVR